MKSIDWSIIVVAYNIENFIEQALLSCVFLGREDYEVIVVENKSTDDTLKFIKRVAADHPGLFKIVENDKNYGLGIGRNIGIDHSQGKYLLFLDGDDWYSPDLLNHLSPVVNNTRCDVLIFNHARVYENGSVVPNKLSRILYEGARDTDSARRKIMDNFGTAWNKAYKASFISEKNFRFGQGFYEDIDWNFETVLWAEKLYAIPVVLIFYRQRNGSITRSTDIRHFDILEQYRRLIELLRQHPVYIIPFGSKMFIYARNQCMTVVNAKDRLPRGTHSRFLKETAKMLKEFRGVIGRNRIVPREWAIASGNIHTYKVGMSMINATNNMKSSVKKRVLAPIRSRWGKLRQAWGRRKRNHIRNWSNERAYRKFFQRLPIEDRLVLLESFWGQKIDCNPYALALALERNGYTCVWSLWENGTKPPHYVANVVRKNSKEYYRVLAQAKYLISNANLPDIWIKRSGQVHIQTFHGTPLKFMGLDIIKTNPKEMNWNNYAERCRRWDFAISSNEYSTRIWRMNAPYNYKILETGYPRNDILFSKDGELIKRIRGDIGIPDDKKVVLYAPTFRESDKNKKRSVANTEVFDAGAIQEAFGDEYVLLVRGHYFLKSDSETRKGSIIDVSSYVLTNEVCLVSDVLITDYSSIMFDFACMGRPIILYVQDFEDYAKSRGMYFDIRESPPGMIVTTFDELCVGIRSCEFLSIDNKRRLKLFRNRFCAFDDGRATDRVLKGVFGVEQDGFCDGHARRLFE